MQSGLMCNACFKISRCSGKYMYCIAYRICSSFLFGFIFQILVKNVIKPPKNLISSWILMNYVFLVVFPNLYIFYIYVGTSHIPWMQSDLLILFLNKWKFRVGRGSRFSNGLSECMLNWSISVLMCTLCVYLGIWVMYSHGNFGVNKLPKGFRLNLTERTK